MGYATRPGPRSSRPQMCRAWVWCFGMVLGFGVPVWAQSEPNVVEIETPTGEVFEGTIAESSEERVVLELPYGRLSVPSSEILRIERVVEPEPEEIPEVVWASRIEVGLLSRQGSETEVSMWVAAGTLRTTERSETSLDGSYAYINSTERKDGEDARVQLLQEWVDPNSPWRQFARGVYRYDAFKSWVQRISGHGGVGYDILKREPLTLIGRLGAGARRTSRGAEGWMPKVLSISN